MITTRADLPAELRAILDRFQSLPSYMDVAEQTVYHELEGFDGDVYSPEAREAERRRAEIEYDLSWLIDWLEQDILGNHVRDINDED